LIGYTDIDLTNLYGDYLFHCYPSHFMNQVVFEYFLVRSRLSLEVGNKTTSEHQPSNQASIRMQLFNAFCTNNGIYVTFRDLTLSLTALEKRCTHGGVGGELRTRCIFRYYTKSGATVITFAE